MQESEKQNEKNVQDEGVVISLGTRRKLTNKVKVYPLGGSLAVLIPRAWLDIFQCDDENGNYWVERRIDGNIITIVPPEKG